MLDGWWAVNFGVLICHQCASCHRGLGRHLSTIQRAPDAAIAPLVEIISKEVRLPTAVPFSPRMKGCTCDLYCCLASGHCGLTLREV